MSSSVRPLLGAAALVVLAFAAAACGASAPTTHRASGAPQPHSTVRTADVAALDPATQGQLDAATLTTADVTQLHLTAEAPVPDGALIWPFDTAVGRYGACAPVQAALQAGRPTYTASAMSDVNITSTAPTAPFTALHLAAYSGPNATAFLDALKTALASCRSYDMSGKEGRDHQAVLPLTLHVGDQAVAWDQTSTYYPALTPTKASQPLQVSYAVVRIGSTVLTAEVDPSGAKSVAPLPAPALLAAAINKIRADIH